MKQPLYQQIIDYLQNEIDSGRLPVGAQVPTEKELSAQFNVSRITSKRALTELETQGVIQRHQGKGSFVQAPKHPLHTSLNKVLFLLPFADDLSVGNFYSGLAPTIQAAGLEVFMTSPNFLREKNAADIVNEFAGLVYYAATSNDYLDLLFELALMNFPVVVLDKKIHDLPFATIQSDNFAGGKTATERLIGLGHTKIGYILSGSPALQSVRQRYLGYLQALKEANPDTDYYFIIGGDMVEYLPKWHRIDDLLHLVQFVGIRRPNYPTESTYPIIWVDVPQMAISSTLIRQKVKSGCSTRYLLPENVINYIQEKGLYQDELDNKL
ncbi:GntR family transcriptional regulator [Enterococcus faecalis]|nr:GntR family transcriptional regulator [Enterococcus faecalis]